MYIVVTPSSVTTLPYNE
ncbi:hypothetical protein AVEN_85107-1, partial [Araneus ventricosus]